MNNQKKLDYSPLFLRIDNIYKTWFRKKGYILNLKNASVGKIRYTIFELVIMLRNDGVDIEDIKNYRKILESPVYKIKWYQILVAILGFLGGNKILTQIISTIIKTYNKKIKFSSLNYYHWINLILSLIVLGCFIRFIFIIINSDSSKRDNEKRAVFKEVQQLFEREEVPDRELQRTNFEKIADRAFGSMDLSWLNNVIDKLKNMVNSEKFFRSIGLIAFGAIFSISTYFLYLLIVVSLKNPRIWMVFFGVSLILSPLGILSLNYIVEYFKLLFTEKNPVTYEIRTKLSGFGPSIWRSFIISGNSSVTMLMRAILFMFNVDSSYFYNLYEPATGMCYENQATIEVINKCKFRKVINAEKVKVSSFEQGNKLILYSDYGDGWEFEVNIKKVDNSIPVPKHPRILSGKGLGITDNMGGVWSLQAYYGTPEGQLDPKIIDWTAGEKIDLDEFDKDGLNDGLMHLDD